VEVERKWVPAVVLVALMVAGFLYCMMASARTGAGYSCGIGLRNVSPCALVFPFLVVLIQAWCRPGGSSGFQTQSCLSAIAIAVVAVGISEHLSRRQSMIQ